MTSDANTRIIAEVSEGPSEIINSTKTVINPNIPKSIINAISNDIIVYLHGRSVSSSKIIEVIGSFTCTLQTNLGTFLLTSSNTPVTLYYDALSGKWTDPTFTVRPYPLTKKTLADAHTRNDGGGTSRQGIFCAINSNEDTIVFTGYADIATSTTQGSIWVFVKDSSNKWSQQGSKLTRGTLPNSGFPLSISIDDTGNEMIVGGGSNDMGPTILGDNEIFRRENSIWPKIQRLVGTNAIGNSNQGRSVSISGDGKTLAVGGNLDDTKNGAVWIFKKESGLWIQETKIAGINTERLGTDVELNYNGTVLLICGHGSSGNRTTYIYIKNNNLWTLFNDFNTILTSKSIAIPAGLGYYNCAMDRDGTKFMAITQLLASNGYVVFITLEGNEIYAQRLLLSNYKEGTLIDNLSINFVGDVAMNRQGTIAVASSSEASTIDVFGYNAIQRTWDYTHTLTLPRIGGIILNKQGISLSFKNTILVVGSPLNYEGIGAVHLYTLFDGKFSFLTTLSGGDYERMSGFGASASMSGDDHYLMIGGTVDRGGSNGSVWFLNRDGSTWRQMGLKHFPTDTSGTNFGWSSSINGDGTVAVVGTLSAQRIYIFRRTDTVWNLIESLQAGDIQGGGFFGRIVAINSDGTKMAIGDPTYSFGPGTNQGAVWYYTYDGTSWSTTGALQGTGTVNFSMMTFSNDGNGPLDISGDGTTIAAGAQNHNSFLDGGVWIFYNGVYQAGPLQGTGTVGLSTRQGTSVALSYDGNTVAFGATFYGANGAVIIFTRTGTTWSEQQIITSSHIVSGKRLGHDLDLSADGNVLMVSRFTVTGEADTICVFERVSGVWIEKTLSPIVETGISEFGPKISMSDEGRIAIATTPNIVQGKADSWSKSGGFVTLA